MNGTDLKLPDSNELLKAGKLPLDPMLGATRPNGKRLEPPPGLFEDDDDGLIDRPQVVPPPADLDAEAAILSCVFCQPDRIGELAPLAPQHFYSEANARVFRAMLDLHAAGTAIDVITVGSNLDARGWLQGSLDKAYLRRLQDQVPWVSNPHEYVLSILDKARGRRLRASLQRFAATAECEAFDPRELLDAVAAEVDRIANDQASDSKGEGRRDRFTLIDAAELFRPVEPIDWIIEGVAAPGVLTEIQAYGSSGKTWAILAGCVAVAAGLPWLGRFPTKQTPTLFLDWESGRREMRRRVQLVAHGLSLTMPVHGLAVASFSPPYLDDVSDFKKAVAAAAAEGYRLIAIDSFLASCPSLQENESSSRRYLDALKGLADKHSIGFVVLTHSKKVSGAVTKVDPREAGRGSSAIFDAADLVFAGTYVEGEPLHLLQTKSRLGKKLDPFDVSITDSDGYRSVLVQAQDPEHKHDATPADNFQKALHLVIDTVRKNPGCTVRFVRSHITGCGGKDTVAAAYERALQRGDIVNRNSGKRNTPAALYVDSSVADREESSW